ncbi:ferredoxin [Streptomyces clavuligerus]|uniref:Ferredoxin n=1 Tax=Streptomyces clavuligerus TaxID=1901 RepID=B5H3N9_STRCL|nr:ferredoxin [Streptomyces clavuligerus]EDY53185.1 hypothetical protein SSCG_06222 [Streptomyces clavuligerus]EFG04048.1 DUF1271 domain-containing protein [Streptomyces clavuligerus]MBY6307463.1 ferredoxin [Streptomyces clavuligerus]QCS09977.1 ferredoxin-1 [Streptomyces clavuligerus]QPJ97980.1 ferredoxin [Streptomyces clavuligerus]
MSTTGPDGARVTADRGACIGAAQCVYSAPAVFDHDDDGVVVVVDPRPGPQVWDAVREAVDLCPVQAVLLRLTAGGS